MHKIIVRKPKARFQVTIESPSGKREVRWVDSKYSIDQICAEYGISTSMVKWEPMK